MRQFRFLPLLRTPVRLLVSLLALVTGISHASALTGTATGSTPFNPTMLQSGCDGGGDSGGGDYCDPTHMDSCFCGCTQSPCFGDGCGDQGGDNGCYYGWNYWGDCSGPG